MKQKKDRKTALVAIRVTPKDKKDILQMARQCEVSISEYLLALHQLAMEK